MSPPKKVLESVYSAIDDFNAVQPPDHQLAKSPDTVLLGPSTALDSLGLVGFLVAVEQQVSADFQKPITLASEKAFSLRNSPFANVGSLTQYVEGLLQESSHGG